MKQVFLFNFLMIFFITSNATFQHAKSTSYDNSNNNNNRNLERNDGQDELLYITNENNQNYNLNNKRNNNNNNNNNNKIPLNFINEYSRFYPNYQRYLNNRQQQHQQQQLVKQPEFDQSFNENENLNLNKNSIINNYDSLSKYKNNNRLLQQEKQRQIENELKLQMLNGNRLDLTNPELNRLIFTIQNYKNAIEPETETLIDGNENDEINDDYLKEYIQQRQQKQFEQQNRAALNHLINNRFFQPKQQQQQHQQEHEFQQSIPRHQLFQAESMMFNENPDAIESNEEEEGVNNDRFILNRNEMKDDKQKKNVKPNQKEEQQSKQSETKVAIPSTDSSSSSASSSSTSLKQRRKLGNSNNEGHTSNLLNSQMNQKSSDYLKLNHGGVGAFKNLNSNHLNYLSDIYFIAIVACISTVAIFSVIGAGYCFYKVQQSNKAAADVDFPAYGVIGPASRNDGNINLKDGSGILSPKCVSPSNQDRKLVQSAQIYHYHHQKQQMISNEKNTSKNNNAGSDIESDEENEDGEYTVYECPGLAPTGEMEIKNPLFQDDLTPMSSPSVNGGTPGKTAATSNETSKDKLKPKE